MTIVFLHLFFLFVTIFISFAITLNTYAIHNKIVPKWWINLQMRTISSVGGTVYNSHFTLTVNFIVAFIVFVAVMTENCWFCDRSLFNSFNNNLPNYSKKKFCQFILLLETKAMLVSKYYCYHLYGAILKFNHFLLSRNFCASVSTVNSTRISKYGGNFCWKTHNNGKELCMQQRWIPLNAYIQVEQ